MFLSNKSPLSHNLRLFLIRKILSFLIKYLSFEQPLVDNFCGSLLPVQTISYFMSMACVRVFNAEAVYKLANHVSELGAESTPWRASWMRPCGKDLIHLYIYIHAWCCNPQVLRLLGLGMKNSGNKPWSKAVGKWHKKARDIITQSASKVCLGPGVSGRKNLVPCLLQASPLSDMAQAAGEQSLRLNSCCRAKDGIPAADGAHMHAVVGAECVLISVLFRAAVLRCMCLMMQMRIARTGSRLRSKAAYFAHSAPSLRLDTPPRRKYMEPLAAAKLFAAAD